MPTDSHGSEFHGKALGSRPFYTKVVAFCSVLCDEDENGSEKVQFGTPVFQGHGFPQFFTVAGQGLRCDFLRIVCLLYWPRRRRSTLKNGT